MRVKQEKLQGRLDDNGNDPTSNSGGESSAPPRRRPFIDPEVIIIGSSSDEAETEPPNHNSDTSDTEECYNIFMEANAARATDSATQVPADGVATQTDNETSETSGRIRVLQGQKGVASDPVNPQPVATIKPSGLASAPQPSDGQELSRQVPMQSGYTGYPPVMLHFHYIIPEGNYPPPSHSMASSMSIVPHTMAPLFTMPATRAYHPAIGAPVLFPVPAPVPAPLQAPVQDPLHAPVYPANAPVHAPPMYAANAPVHAPVDPTQAPGHAPVRHPAQGPVHAPVDPTQAPGHAPVHHPAQGPVHAPLLSTQAPGYVPVHHPAQGPVHAPVLSTQPPGHAPVHHPAQGPVHAPVLSTYTPGHAPGYHPAQGPVHAPVLSTYTPGHAPGYHPAQGPVHAPVLSTYTPGHAPGYHPAQGPGHAPLLSTQAPGYAPVHHPVQGPGHAPLLSTQAPGYAPVHHPAQGPGHAPGHAPLLSTQAPGHAPVRHPAQGPGHAPVLSTQAPGHAPVRHPAQGPVHAPVHPTRDPGHAQVPDMHHRAPNNPIPPTTPVEAKRNAPTRPTTAVEAKRNAPIPPNAAVEAKRNTPSLTSVTASIHRRQTTPSVPICIPAQPLNNKRKAKSCADDKVPHDEPPPTKRKAKNCPEEEVSHDMRQRSINQFKEALLKTNVDDAFGKALAEEKIVFSRSNNAVKYQSDVVNALKKLKTRYNVTVAKAGKEVGAHNSRGSIPLKTKMLQGNAPLYDVLKEYILKEQPRIEEGYPFQHPSKRYSAALLGGRKNVTTNSNKKICSRCGATYSVGPTGRYNRMEECHYHYGKGVEKRVPGGVETRYSCCEAVMGSPGCQVFKLHVHDGVSLDGFQSTRPRPASDKSCPGVYSLNCEKCYTNRGVELSRVTLVNSSLQVLYDTFVRPANDVVDYNTRFSGISEKDVKDIEVSIKEVQKTLQNLIRADTILIGHSLDMDLCLLKVLPMIKALFHSGQSGADIVHVVDSLETLCYTSGSQSVLEGVPNGPLIHDVVVDTSVVFPHRLGPPHKVALNTLVAEHLRRITSDDGHDTAEDARACMELMLWKIKEDGKVRRF